jgi:hypothetical protein
MGDAAAGVMDEALGYSPVAVKELRPQNRGLRFFCVLQDFLQWRDPDSNRGHHDFQICPETYGSPPQSAMGRI